MSKAHKTPPTAGSWERDPKTGALKQVAKPTEPRDVAKGREHLVDKAAAAAAAEASAASGFPQPQEQPAEEPQPAPNHTVPAATVADVKE